MKWESLPRRQITDLEQHVVALYTHEDADRRARVLDAMVLTNEAYVAVQLKDKKTGHERVFAGICLLEKSEDEVRWLPLQESDGVAAYQCPKRILSLLSDTDDPAALAWRGRCKERIDAIHRGTAVEAGHTVRFTAPIHFSNGETHREFLFEGRNRFRAVVDGAPSAELFEIPGWQGRGWATVAPFPENCISHDFRDGAGPVPARPHPNGGGLVAVTAWVDPLAYVGRDACVMGNARIFGAPRIEGGAIVRDNAVVEGRPVISEQAVVADFARVSGEAVVRGAAKVIDKAQVFERAKVDSYARICEGARIAGDARIEGRAVVSGSAVVAEQATVDGRAIVSEAAVVLGASRVSDRARVLGRAVVSGAATVLQGTEVSGEQRLTGPENVTPLLPNSRRPRP